MAPASFPWLLHVCNGAGVLVSPTCALTARHVVGEATSVEVTFPFSGTTRTATVESVPTTIDLALLRFGEPVDLPPAPVRPSVKTGKHLVLVPGNLSPTDDVPRVARARVTAGLPGGLMQIDIEPGEGYGIVPGHSGAPVIDEDLGAVIGVCVSREPKQDVRVARFLVVERVGEVVPELSPWLGWRLTEERAEVGGLAPFAELHSYLCNARRAHWFPRAFGAQAGGSGTVPDLFHGRTVVLDELRALLDELAAGVVVVTGEPGAGKSAVVSRLVVERDPLEGHGAGRRFSYAFFAKDRAAEHLVRGVADALGGPHDAQTEQTIDLVREHRPALAIDGLDEASPGQGPAIMSLAQTFAGAGATVIVGARRSAIPKRFSGSVIDLDDDRYFRRQDLVEYTLAVLCRPVTPGLPNPWATSDKAGTEAGAIADTAGRNFLVSGLLALTRSMSDPSEPVTAQSGELAGAFDALLERLDDQLGWRPR